MPGLGLAVFPDPAGSGGAVIAHADPSGPVAGRFAPGDVILAVGSEAEADAAGQNLAAGLATAAAGEGDRRRAAAPVSGLVRRLRLRYPAGWSSSESRGDGAGGGGLSAAERVLLSRAAEDRAAALFRAQLAHCGCHCRHAATRRVRGRRCGCRGGGGVCAAVAGAGA